MLLLPAAAGGKGGRVPGETLSEQPALIGHGPGCLGATSPPNSGANTFLSRGTLAECDADQLPLWLADGNVLLETAAHVQLPEALQEFLCFSIAPATNCLALRTR